MNVTKVMRRAAAPLTTRGTGRSCPVCGWTGGRFVTFGRAPNVRTDAQCPRCGALERHRLVHLLLADRLGPSEDTLHVAPERAVTPWLTSVSTQGYLSIDLKPGKAMAVGDLTDLADVADGTYSLVYCSHVLEHIPDDARAMAEMERVLQPGGRAVVLVPTSEVPTDEDPSIDDLDERTRRFGQADHVRLYGLDIADRLRAAGFEVEVLGLDDCTPEQVVEHQLDFALTRHVFVATKPALS